MHQLFLYILMLEFALTEMLQMLDLWTVTVTCFWVKFCCFCQLNIFLFYFFCHFQYIQLQQQEMNEFTEDERRNLEVTVCEMENEVRTI